MNGEDRLSPLVDMLRRVAPEDFPPEIPIYLLTADEGIRQILGADDCGACTSNIMSWQLRPYLEDTGRWQGLGYCAAFYTSHVNELAGIAIHEAAHMIVQGRPMPASNYRKLATAAGWTGEVPLTDFIEGCTPVSAPAWRGHGVDFIRAALHLHARWPDDVPIEHLRIAGRRYGLTPAQFYAWRLEDELQSHPTGSIREILETPPPTEFAELFRADTQ